MDDEDAVTTAPPGARRLPGHTDAHDALFATLYVELKRMARRESRRHGNDAVLGPTTLLHDAYLQLAGRAALTFEDHGRFLAYAARAMRGLVIDGIRARASAKRGGGVLTDTTLTQTAETVHDAELLQRISDALDELAALDPQLANVVDLRFFCGFSMAEIAAQQGLTERTVQRHWEKARTLLFQSLQAG